MLRAVAVACLLLLTPLPAHATEGCWDIAWRCDTVNAYRAEHGLPPLDQDGDLQRGAKAWALTMADDGILAHDPNPGADEIVGMAPDWPTVMAAWDLSPHHKAILLGDRGRVGLGVARSADGTLFAVVRFR